MPVPPTVKRPGACHRPERRPAVGAGKPFATIADAPPWLDGAGRYRGKSTAMAIAIVTMLNTVLAMTMDPAVAESRR